MNESNAVVRRVDLDPALSSVDRLKVLLAARGLGSPGEWAKLCGFNRSMVWHALMGRRRNAETERILNRLAQDVGKSRRVIDALVAGDQVAEDVADGSEVSHADKVESD